MFTHCFFIIEIKSISKFGNLKIPFSKSTLFKLFFNPVFLLEKAKERMVLARPTSNLKLHH